MVWARAKSIFRSPSGLGTWRRRQVERTQENAFYCGFKGVGVRNMFFSLEIAMFLPDFDYFQWKNNIFWEFLRNSGEFREICRFFEIRAARKSPS